MVAVTVWMHARGRLGLVHTLGLDARVVIDMAAKESNHSVALFQKYFAFANDTHLHCLHLDRSLQRTMLASKQTQTVVEKDVVAALSQRHL